jgi:hypothetical protein
MVFLILPIDVARSFHQVPSVALFVSVVVGPASSALSDWAPPFFHQFLQKNTVGFRCFQIGFHHSSD